MKTFEDILQGSLRQPLSKKSWNEFSFFFKKKEKENGKNNTKKYIYSKIQ